MKKLLTKNLFSFLVLSLILFLFFITTSKTSAFSIGAKPIIIENALRGTEIVEYFKIINSEANPITLKLQASGEIASWVSFYDPDDLKLQNPVSEITVAPKKKVKVPVKFQIPQDVPNGTYKGEISAVKIVPESQKGKIGVGVFTQLGKKVEITVTDKEILDFSVQIIPMKLFVPTNQPLQIKVIYQNNGNVYIKPDLHLKIIHLSTGKVVHNAIYPYPEEESPVKPFERKVFENLIEWQTYGQPKGKYKAEVKVLLNGKEYDKKEFSFKVGYDIREILMAWIGKIGGGNVLLGWFVLGAIFALIAGILTILHKNPQILEKIKNFRINKQL